MKLRMVKGGKQFFIDAKSRKMALAGLEGGKKLKKAFFHDTAERASPLGARHLLKDFLAKGLRALTLKF